MRIDFSVDGGLAAFPGLAKPVTIDCEALPPGRSAHLRELMRRADFFSLPTKPPASAVPDTRRYTISVDDGRQCSKVTVAEPIDNDALRELVAELCDHARAARRGR